MLTCIKKNVSRLPHNRSAMAITRGQDKVRHDKRSARIAALKESMPPVRALTDPLFILHALWHLVDIEDAMESAPPALRSILEKDKEACVCAMRPENQNDIWGKAFESERIKEIIPRLPACVSRWSAEVQRAVAMSRLEKEKTFAKGNAPACSLDERAIRRLATVSPALVTIDKWEECVESELRRDIDNVALDIVKHRLGMY